MDLKKLQTPFKEQEVEWRIGQAGKTAKGPWAKVLAYIEARAIMDRLDEVVGPENWQVHYHFIKEPIPGVTCSLTIKINSNNDWITKSDGADFTDVEAFKGGISSALKRAAVLWGIGRYLYNLEEGWATIAERGQPGARFYKSKDGTNDFYWIPPKLPAWALPTEQKKIKEDKIPF